MCWLEKIKVFDQAEIKNERKALGFSEVEIENLRNREGPVLEKMIARDKDMAKQNVNNKVRKAKYNRR
ncbi:hypothetical protein TSAR_002995 [Trichomalopsis sarcophagae]|uniref:Uncharacterized protein n=1 Tax=Trichomalopsis sarcophagae TaxID=543379 RepID=A0A232ETU6_9HYME|nr:hypothetical protein TSAR_002995 [Trichomalopsis sarcophagae]